MLKNPEALRPMAEAGPENPGHGWGGGNLGDT